MVNMTAISDNTWGVISIYLLTLSVLTTIMYGLIGQSNEIFKYFMCVVASLCIICLISVIYQTWRENKK